MANLSVIGFTSCGKSTVGRAVAKRLGMEFADLDRLMEEAYLAETGTARTCREIYDAHGAEDFRAREAAALRAAVASEGLVLATGGGAPLRPENRELLRQFGVILYLLAEPETLYGRMQRKGLPRYLANDPTVEGLRRVWLERDPVYRGIADVIVQTDHLSVNGAVDLVLRNLKGRI